MQEPTLLELLKSGVHFGHQTSRWHPRMQPFIFTSRNGIHIINLEKSLEHIKSAQAFLREVAASGGSVIFIGTKRQAKEIIRQHAEASGALFITERWLGGLFTNFSIVSRLVQRLRKLTDDRKSGNLEKYTKKERLRFDEEITKLEKLVGGIRELRRLPQAVFVVDIKTEKTAVREARKIGIPIVAMVDTNTDPEGITYPIPANDDATKSIELVTRLMADALKEGRMIAEEKGIAAAAAVESSEGAGTSSSPAIGQVVAEDVVVEKPIQAMKEDV